MNTTDITINNTLKLLACEFYECPRLWDDEKRDILYCFFKEEPGYFCNITENIDALETQGEGCAASMFADAMAVLFAAKDEENEVRLSNVMFRLAQVIALYIYSTPISRRRSNALNRKKVVPVSNIPDRVLSREDIEDTAVLMYAKPDGIHITETASTLRIGLGHILMLLWERCLDELKEYQAHRLDVVKAIVREAIVENK